MKLPVPRDEKEKWCWLKYNTSSSGDSSPSLVSFFSSSSVIGDCWFLKTLLSLQIWIIDAWSVSENTLKIKIKIKICLVLSITKKFTPIIGVLYQYAAQNN